MLSHRQNATMFVIFDSSWDLCGVGDFLKYSAANMFTVLWQPCGATRCITAPRNGLQREVSMEHRFSNTAC